MNTRDKYFKGQQSDETLICFCRHHWISLVRELSYFLLFLLIVIFVLSKIDVIKEILRGNRELKILFVTGFLISNIYIHRFFIKLLNFFLDVEIITDRRIIEHQKTLFFKDTIDAIDMGQIQNIEMDVNGIMPNLLGYGDIKVYLNASSAIKTFPCMPNAKFHFRCISRQKEALQQRSREHTGLITEKTHNLIENSLSKEPEKPFQTITLPQKPQ